MAVIVGVGTDIADVRRIDAALARHGLRFAERVLGAHELQVFHARRARLPSRGVRYLATRFSAKEAFSKAVGLGLRTPMSWRACEVVNAPGGQPQIRLNGALAAWFEARQWVAHLSVTDETDYAAAFVVVETAARSP